MVGFLLVCALVGVDADDRDGRGFHEIQADIRRALRQESAADRFADRAVAVCELCALHQEIVGDRRFLESPTLKEYRNQVAIRLLAVQHDLQRQLRKERLREGGRRPPDQPAMDSRQVDAQAASLAGQLALAGYLQGGPVQLTTAGSAGGSPGGSAGGNRGGGMVPDNGQALVDLIQRTIKPDHWDVNGGPGSIVYFAPLRCLVVRASAEVHHALGGAVDGLRAAGK